MAAAALREAADDVRANRLYRGSCNWPDPKHEEVEGWLRRRADDIAARVRADRLTATGDQP